MSPALFMCVSERRSMCARRRRCIDTLRAARTPEAKQLRLCDTAAADNVRDTCAAALREC